MYAREFLTESTSTSREHFNDIADDFIAFAMKELELETLPNIEFRYEPLEGTFGHYNPEDQSIVLVAVGRHPVDIFRTLAHEMVHYKQDMDNKLHPESGETGSDEENEANALAGVVMRNFSREYPDYIKTLRPL